MQIHNLSSNKKKRKRIGRGGKRGTYSGRGQKGQKARAGHRIRPAERDIILKFPKLRGIKNKPKSRPSVIIKTSDLEKIKDLKISKKTLIKAGLIKKKSQNIKILADGQISRPFELSREIKISKSVKKGIKSIGGKII